MTHVLVPLAILEGESVPVGLIDLLGTVDVTILGYHVVPEQTPPDQARLQYEDRANEALADVTDEFRQAGGHADDRLVFTHDRRKTIQRVADETDSRAYAITGATGAVERLLVPLTGDVAVERILSFVAELVGDRDVGVTLFRATGEETEEDTEKGGDEQTDEEVLADAASVLSEQGVDVRTELAVGRPPFEALVDAAAGHDVIVLGEQAPSLQSLLFGDEAQRVATESVGPVLVVRREQPSE